MIGSSTSWARFRNLRSGTMTLPSPTARSARCARKSIASTAFSACFATKARFHVSIATAISTIHRGSFATNSPPAVDFSELSDGAFDITVQPLWQLYAAHFWTGTDKSPDIDAAAQDVARRLVDYRLVDISPKRISLGRRGMGVTLNSVGQGFVADRIADMLQAEGFAHVYADLGEIRLIGDHPPDGRPWRIGLRDPTNQATYGRMLDLEDIGLAVSGGYGTTFEETGRYNHIFDPRTGLSADKMSAIAVTAPSAMIANGLATSIYVAGREHAAKILAAYPGAKAVITTADDEWLASQADGSFAAI